MKLVDKKYSWIFKKSNDKQNDSINYELSNMNIDFKIIDLNEIKRNYSLCNYAVRLASVAHNQLSIASYYVIDEIISLLHKSGLFDDAIIASNLFNASSSSLQSLNNIFISLVDRCCFNDNKNKQYGEFQSEFDFLRNNNSIPISFTPYEKYFKLNW